jgi:hypothetical protein
MPCRARAIPRPCRSESDFSRPRHNTAWTWHVWISIGRPETACERPACVRLLPATMRSSTKIVIKKYTNPLNCRTSSSDISGYYADFHEGHGTVGEWQGRGMAWQGNGKGAAWHVWISFYPTRIRSPFHSPNLTYLLHGGESFLWSWPVFATNQEIPRILWKLYECAVLYNTAHSYSLLGPAMSGLKMVLGVDRNMLPM